MSDLSSSPYHSLISSLPIFKEPELSLNDFNTSKLIDYHLINNSDYPFGVLTPPDSNSQSQPSTPSLDDLVTWNEVGSAIVKIVNQLHNHQSSPSSLKASVIGLLVGNDPMVYYTIVLAIIRAGYIPFLISPRNSPAAIAHLLKEADCHRVYVPLNLNHPNSSSDVEDVTQKLLRTQIKDTQTLLPNDYRLELLEFPTALQLFPRMLSSSASSSSYEPNLNLSQQLSRISISQPDEFQPIINFHSSGSTGLPKLIPMNRLTFYGLMSSSQFGDFDWLGQISATMALPPYHVMGVWIGIFLVLSRGSVSGYFRPELDPHSQSSISKTPNSLNVMKAMKALGSHVILSSPFMISDWASEPESVDFLKTMNCVAYGGGPLAMETGDRLVKEGVKLFTLYGLTEAGLISVCFPNQALGSDWSYFQLSPQINSQLSPQDDGTYELVIKSTETHRCSFGYETEFKSQIYHTKDLVIQHPHLPSYVQIVGRLDDQITLSNSEKTNPVPIELLLNRDQAISGTLVFGRGKPQIGLIVEPKEDYILDLTDPTAVDGYIDLIWPSIEAANKLSPAHSRITRNLILITDPRTQKLTRTSKGAISRPSTLKLMSDQIEQLYQDSNTNENVLINREDLIDPDSQKVSFDRILIVVQNLVNQIVGSEIDPETDIFLQGCDSVHAAMIRTRTAQLLKKLVLNDPINIPTNLIYQHPSLSDLSKWIVSQSVESSTATLTSNHHHDACILIKFLIKKYSPPTFKLDEVLQSLPTPIQV